MGNFTFHWVQNPGTAARQLQSKIDVNAVVLRQIRGGKGFFYLRNGLFAYKSRNYGKVFGVALTWLRDLARLAGIFQEENDFVTVFIIFSDCERSEAISEAQPAKIKRLRIYLR